MALSAEEYYNLALQEPVTPVGNEKAKAQLLLAIKGKPDYLPAYAELSYVYVREYQNGWGKYRAASLDEARAWADKAVVLGNDPKNPYHNDFKAPWYRAIVYWNDGEFVRSFQEFEVARNLIPDADKDKNEADLDADMAEAYVYFGEPDRAVELIENAKKKNPGFAYWYLWTLGRAHYMAKRYDEAIRAIDDIYKMVDPVPNDVRLIKAASQAQLNLADAPTTMAEFSNNDTGWSITKSGEYRYNKDADRQHWLAGLRLAGLKEA
ncbi:tetratricopeptide repeat protein [Sinorhizobium sp. BG8]|uniref:tetratricopeptide repeat protein n=1 Tax=Sinorhizobium sp. BG8 TaxID=2613773 RepID=UPI00193EC08F|nr:tetratricopeptide repeat protein [Sinorhizobium sp. BG8]QRM55498.1 tetratricopeptide repeat protein [Sinorhizobium sp. BG8]